MKKIILTSITSLALLSVNAQSIVVDTVSTGAGYANQVWYSLDNDEQGSAPKNNWDIAFDVTGFGTSIHINSITGTMLWSYPAADTSGWATLDTTGIDTWPALYNSDTSWAIGAFDAVASGSNMFDVGWGIYDLTTHIVTGDSLFVIKLANGTYKKLWIQNLNGSVYTFKHADLDNTNEQLVSFQKSPYSGKNFGYYSLQTNTAIDREPVASAQWDLLFTQYTAFISMGGPVVPYTVAGVLSNKGVTVAQANDIGDVVTYQNYGAHTFISPINENGYDWKTFTGTAYAITDSLIYFVTARNGDIWKVIFTGFSGGASGNFVFSKQKLVSVAGIQSIEGNNIATMSVYPNPSNGTDVTLLYNLKTATSNVNAYIFDIAGKLISTMQLSGNSGLHTQTLEITNLNPGMYIVTVEANGQRMNQRLVIR